MICVLISLTGLGLATAASLLGPWSVLADAFSHFRMHMAAGSLLLAGIAVALAGKSVDPRLFGAALLIALINAGLSLAYDWAPRVASAGGPTFKVLTINVLHRVNNDDEILAQIAVEQPDVVLFQELNRARRSLLQRLQASYPHQISCAGTWTCDVAIVSRHPWEAAKAEPVSYQGHSAKLAWARFGAARGNLLVASLHLRWPLVSDQAAQLAAVRETIADHTGPMIVAGDLNAAPWSAAVKGFTRQSHLRSAGGFTPTWPRRNFANGTACTLCIPQLQIDHIFVSDNIRVLGVRAGPDVGSDHLPLIAELELPRQVAAYDTSH
jgi:endonuclease/exonuclease/phosphatase (EEP) superfamily protein YafD